MENPPDVVEVLYVEWGIQVVLRNVSLFHFGIDRCSFSEPSQQGIARDGVRKNECNYADTYKHEQRCAKPSQSESHELIRLSSQPVGSGRHVALVGVI